MNLDINQLRAFVTVAQLRSFSKASQRLCRVQSAVSQQVQKLEGHLGAALFVRDRRSLQLTPQGENLLAYALKILEVNDHAVAALTEKAANGVVRVGTSDTYASMFFADILQVCAARFPDVGIEVHCGFSTHIWQKYENGELDVVLTQGCPAHIPSQLLHSEPLKWVCARSSTVYSKDPVPLALFAHGCGDRDLALNALHQVGKSYKVNYHSTSHAGIVAAVNSGCYVSAILLTTVQSELRVLGEAQGYPAMGNLDISLACRDSSGGNPMQHFAEVARNYFRSLSAGQLVHTPEYAWANQ
jgi:DNA-binding transcriptional LysR family regulator